MNEWNDPATKAEDCRRKAREVAGVASWLSRQPSHVYSKAAHDRLLDQMRRLMADARHHDARAERGKA